MRALFTTLMVLAGLFAGAVAFAQEPVQEQEQNQQEVKQAVKPYKVYCEIVATPKLFSNKTTVEFDFGQFSGFWNLEEVFIVQNISNGDSGTTRYHWVLSKMVTDDSQITEGLQTKGMNK